MKFTKVSAADSKTKKILAEKSKFKSKESAAAPNSKLKTNIKHAANLLKKGSLDKDIASLVKSYQKVTDSANPPDTKRKPSKSGKLSPEVQLGLRLDAILEKKSGRKHGIATSKNGQNMSKLLSETAPKLKMNSNETKTNLNVNRFRDSLAPNTVVKIPDSDAEAVHRNKRKKKKEFGVLKNEFVSSDGISPYESESSPTKKSKRKRGNNKTNNQPTSSGSVHVVAKNEEEKEVAANSDTVNFALDPMGLKVNANSGKKFGRKRGIATCKTGQNMPKSQSGSDAETAHRNKRKKKKASGVFKNEFVSSDDISPNESESSPTKKSKGKYGNNKTNIPPTSSGSVHVAKNEEEKEVAANSDTVNFALDPKNILDAVRAALELHRQNSGLSNKLLDSEPEPLFLKLDFFVGHPQKKTIRFDLAHSLVRNESDICLFVSDMSKKKPDDSKCEWEEILQKENVKNISEVIPLKTLLQDYSQFQDKRKLSARFDCFLVEGKISHRVFGILGNKFFHTRRKTPTPVILTRGSVKNHIDNALLKTVAQYKQAAQSFSVEIGHGGMKDEDIRDNILKVWEQYPMMFGVYWENIRKASLLLHETHELPVFCSLDPPAGEMRVYKDMVWRKESNIPIVGELSTVNDQKVLVYPSGKVYVQKPVKKVLDAEELAARKLKRKERRKEAKSRAKTQADKEECSDSDDSWAARADMLIDDDSDSEEPEFEEVDSGKEKPKDKKKSDRNKKKEKIKVDDSDEFDVDKAEEMYLQRIAKQKAKAPEKKLVGKVTSAEALDLDTDGGADLGALGNGMSSESSDGEELLKSTLKQSPERCQFKMANVAAKKVQVKKGQSKRGPMKSSSPRSKGKQKKHVGDKSSFQGIKTADQVQKKQKKSKETIRKKAIAKQLK